MSGRRAGASLHVAARAVAGALRAAGVPNVVIGSFALALVADHLLDTPPRDLDLLLPDELPVLERACRALAGAGYVVTSWDEPVALPLAPERVCGRFYLRARREAVVVDLTYECPWLDFAQVQERAVAVAPFCVASLDDLLALAAARGQPRDLALLARAGH